MVQFYASSFLGRKLLVISFQNASIGNLCNKDFNEGSLAVDRNTNCENFWKQRASATWRLCICSYRSYKEAFGIVSLLRKYANEKNLLEGKRIHDYINKKGFGHDRFLGNHLIQMYGHCGDLQSARAAFDNMHRRNSFSWNLLVAAYIRKGHMKEALHLFEQMPKKDVVAWTTMLTGYIHSGQLNEAIQIFQKMPQRNVVTWTAMISSCTRQGMLKEARIFFDKMPERNLYSWNAMFTAYAKLGHLKEAVNIFEQMPERDVVSWTTLILAHSHGGQLKEAFQLFQRMAKKDLVLWNTMITAYAQHGCGKEALQLFQQMFLEGMIPDAITINGILYACARDGLVDEGCHHIVSVYHDHQILPDLEHFNCLVDLLGRLGWVANAEVLVNNMPFSPDATTWKALLASCRTYAVQEILGYCCRT